MLENKLLSYFVCACQHHHLAKAAAELEIAPSTMTMALQTLEANLGWPLFCERMIGHLPTPHALQLYQVAIRALHAEKFVRSFASRGDPDRLARILIHHQFIFTLGRFAKAASRAIDQVQQEHPSTFYEPFWRDGVGASATTEKNATTIIVGYDAGDHDEAEIFRVGDDPWVLARDLPMSMPDDISVQDLLRGPVVVPLLPEALSRQAEAFIRSGRIPNARLLSVDPSMLARVANEAPDTAFLIPSAMLATRLGFMRLRAVTVGPELVSAVVAKVVAPSPAALAYVDAFRSELAAGERNAIFRPEMTIRQMRYFTAMYDNRTMTAAARKVHIAQPALSNQLTTIEKLIGSPLFERHRDGLAHTPAGSRMAKAIGFVQPTLQSIEVGEFKHVMTGPVVRMGVLPAVSHNSMMIRTIASAIAEWRKLYPHGAMQVLEAPNAKLQSWLLFGKIGVAVIERDLPQVARFNLGSVEELAVIVNPRFGLLPRGQTTLSELSSIPLVLPTTSFGIRQILDEAARQADISIAPVLEINSLPLITAMIRDGPIATVLPPSAVQTELQEGVLMAHSVLHPQLERRLYFIYTTLRTLTDAERTFSRLVREAAKRSQSRGTELV